MRGIRKASDQRDLGRLAFILDRTKILLPRSGRHERRHGRNKISDAKPDHPGKALGKGAIFEQNRE
jgi:hypothetical protein